MTGDQSSERAGEHPCDLCRDDGFIERPEEAVEVTFLVRRMTEGGRMLDEDEVTQTESVGGLDACPRCAWFAENEYQYRRENN